MRKSLLILLLLLSSISTFAQSYLLKWNSTSSKYEIKQINLSTNSITNVGTSSTMTSEYDIDEIYYDKLTNQIVGLYQDNDLWKYNLTTNTDQIVDLGTDYYRDLVVSNGRAYLIQWNSGDVNYEVKQLNLSTNTVSYLGATSTLTSEYDIDEIHFDKSNNQLLALFQDNDLGIYSLGTNTDLMVDFGTDYYRGMTVADGKAFLFRWNNTTSKYDIKEINLGSNTLSHIGSSSTMTSEYDIDEVYYDKANNQIVGVFKDNDLWKYNLTNNTDQIVDLGTDYYRDMVVVEQAIATNIINEIQFSEEDEIVRIIDVLGIELKSLEPNKPLVIVYKSGATKKVYLSE